MDIFLSDTKRAALVQELLVRPVSFDDETYQTLLHDCTKRLTSLWDAPAREHIDSMLREQGCQEVINPLHVLAHWLLQHPLYTVVRRLPNQLEPSDIDVKNALRGAVKDLKHRLENTQDENEANLLHEYIMRVGETREAEARAMRNLCMMLAIDPFDALYELAPDKGKPLN